jgi:hypothetical protein
MIFFSVPTHQFFPVSATDHDAHKEDCKIGVEFLFLSWGTKSLAKPKILQMVQPKNKSEI